MPPLVVRKGKEGADARIMKAVKQGRGWRYTTDPPQKARLVTPGGLGPSDIVRRRNNDGTFRYVSKKRSKASKKNYKKAGLKPGSKKHMAKLRKMK